MAIERNIKITVDTGKAVKETDKLTDSIEDVGQAADKSMDRYSGAIKKSNPLVEKLNSLTGGLLNTFLDVGDAAKKAGISMRTALIATGVGALVVGLGLVVAYWDDIVELIGQANRNLERQLELNTINSDLIGSELKLIDKRLGLLKKEGKSNEILQEQKKALVEQAKLLNEQQILILEKQLIRLEATKEELSLWEQIKGAALIAFGGAEGAARASADLVLERSAAINKLKQDILDAKGAAVDLDSVLFDINNPEGADGEEKKRDKEVSALGDLNKALAVESEATIRARESLNNALLAEEKRLADGEVAIRHVSAEEQKAIEERLKNAKINIATQTLGNLGSLAKEGSDLAKGIAASQATINTFQGVTAALSATSVIPDPFGTILKFVNAAAIGVSGAINVKKILSTKPVTTSAPSGGGASPPPAPSFNLVEGTASNQIADSVKSGNQPVKAFVVSGDVTSKQELDRNIEGNASLG